MELLHSTHNAVVPGIVGLGKDGNWDVFFAKQTQTGDLGANGRYTHGDFYSSQVFLLTKPDDVSLPALYADSKLLMDLMLRGTRCTARWALTGAHRSHGQGEEGNPHRRVQRSGWCGCGTSRSLTRRSCCSHCRCPAVRLA
jgi:hypothetical protein